MIINFNGQFIEKTEASISLLSPSFMYGFGVFETLRTYNHRIFKAPEHLNRLFVSAEKIGIEIKISPEKIAQTLQEVVEKSVHANQRLKITAIEEGILITSQKLEIDPAIYQGVSCMTIEAVRPIPEAKTISYLSSYLNHHKAVTQGHYEALLVDQEGYITEGAYSNFFWFEGDTLCTRKEGVLEGITRETVIDLSPFPIEYKKLKASEITNVSESFLTQTTTGIVPVGKIGKNTVKLQTLFTNLSQNIG